MNNLLAPAPEEASSPSVEASRTPVTLLPVALPCAGGCPDCPNRAPEEEEAR